MPILKVKNENGTWSEIGGTSVVIGEGGGSVNTDNCITGLSASGRTITYTRGNGSTGTITTQDNDTIYTHPTSAGNKHIPSGGGTDQYLGYAGSSGTATWKTGFGKAGSATGSVILGNSTASGVHSVAGATGGASGQYSSAFGYSSYAVGDYSTAICSATSNGDYSFAQGLGSNSEGDHSVAIGNFAYAQGNYQVALGKYNAGTAGPTSLMDTTGALLIVGNGTADSNRNNVLNLQTAGNMWLKGEYKTTGADYAEYFEWSDGNMGKEDRRGRFVTIDSDEKIRYATSEDDYILGVVSAAPSVVGDSYDDSWHGKYLKDVYGAPITEMVEVPERIDEETGAVIPAHVDVRFVINPNYNATEDYIPRKDRSEWSPIGMMGKLVVVDDGTCEVNGYASVGANGVATKGDRTNGYRVIARLDDNHIKVIFK